MLMRMLLMRNVRVIIFAIIVIIICISLEHPALARQQGEKKKGETSQKSKQDSVDVAARAVYFMVEYHNSTTIIWRNFVYLACTVRLISIVDPKNKGAFMIPQHTGGVTSLFVAPSTLIQFMNYWVQQKGRPSLK